MKRFLIASSLLTLVIITMTFSIAHTENISAWKPLQDEIIIRYIKTKTWNHSIAIKIAKIENFWNLTKSFDNTRVNFNENGSYDLGIFQINSIHSDEIRKLYNMSFDQAMSDYIRNIDFAFHLYKKKNGFTDWVTYKKIFTPKLEMVRYE